MEETAIPADYPVQPVEHDGPTIATCGTCGRKWDDSKSTSMTPVPSGRCPFEPFHADPEEDEDGPDEDGNYTYTFTVTVKVPGDHDEAEDPEWWADAAAGACTEYGAEAEYRFTA